MAKLNQIIAIEKGIKSRVNSELSEIYKSSQKSDLFNGFSKEYRPKDEEGERLPPEKKKVQLTAHDILRRAGNSMSELMEVTARKDFTNCYAKADVIVDGKVLLVGAPVTYLLFLEKQLLDLRTMIDTLPVRDYSEEWSHDENSGLARSAVISTHRTKKIQRALQMTPTTVEHPGTAQLITEDVIAGFWESIKFTGAISAPDKEKLSEKANAVLRAVKEAREAANMEEEAKIPQNDILNYVLGD